MKRFIVLSLLSLLVCSIHVFGQNKQRFALTEKTILLHNNVRLEYVEQGDPTGIPVIFLHGFPDSWHSFENVLPYLPENIHAFAISQRGHGNSDRPANGYRPADFAADLANFVKQLELGYVIVVGHSVGSIVAQQFMLDYPKMTRGVVLEGSVSTFSNNTDILSLRDMTQTFKDPIDREFVDEFQKSTIVGDIEPAFFNVLMKESMKVTSHVWKAVLQGLVDFDFKSRLRESDRPVLIIWGTRDNIASRTEQDILTRSLKNSRLKIYKNSGHSLHWVEPKRFVKDLLAFIPTTGRL